MDLDQFVQAFPFVFAAAAGLLLLGAILTPKSVSLPRKGMLATAVLSGIIFLILANATHTL